MTTRQTQPTAADFLARNRGGGLFTMTVSQRIGAYLSVAAYKLGLAPTVLTIGNLVIGLGTSIVVLTLVPRDHKSHLVVGLAALVLWHLAYALDCADGQLGRQADRHPVRRGDPDRAGGRRGRGGQLLRAPAVLAGCPVRRHLDGQPGH